MKNYKMMSIGPYLNKPPLTFWAVRVHHLPAWYFEYGVLLITFNTIACHVILRLRRRYRSALECQHHLQRYIHS